MRKERAISAGNNYPGHKRKLSWRHPADRNSRAQKEQIERLAQDLRSHVGESCYVAQSFFERKNYSRDLARVPPLLEKMLFRPTPLLIVQPMSEGDIVNILKFCRSRGLAVFPRGVGSFAFGGSVPTRKGIVLDLSPMMAILKVDPDKYSVRVQPGARWADVAEKIEEFGLIPVTTPTSRFSTVGGWIATGGMGLGSYAHGNIRASVQGIRVARPDGTLNELDSRDESIKDLFGTEGQFGIMTEIILRVRPKPRHSGVCMLTFDSPASAFEFTKEVSSRGHHCSHMAFFDREYMRKENILFTEHTGLSDPIVPEKDAVLLHFENPESERHFLALRNGDADRIHENHIAARYLWSERYFPLKSQRISPGLLGTEVVVPQSKISRYIRKIRKLGSYFDIIPTIEVIYCREKNAVSNLVILSFPCDYSRKLHYVFCLLFTQLLVRQAVRLRGYPYGLGIWNTPFVKNKHKREILEEFKKKKQAIDPDGMLNPDKFFKIKGRFFNIPAFFMRPVPFRTLLAFSHFFAPVLGLVARLLKPKQSGRWDVPAKEYNQGRALLHQSAQRCTSCGSCISVCPAYHITRDELVAGRTKLRMAEEMMNGIEMEGTDVHSPFQCLHCGLCEEVCQTRLPLRDCYDVLEDWIEIRFGSPTETIRNFIEKLDGSREYIRDIFGLDIPEWSPDKLLPKVIVAERMPGGDGP